MNHARIRLVFVGSPIEENEGGSQGAVNCQVIHLVPALPLARLPRDEHVLHISVSMRMFLFSFI